MPGEGRPVPGDLVSAVVCGTAAGELRRTRAAIEAGTVLPAVVHEAADLPAAALAAAEAALGWTWFLAAGAAPTPSALAELLRVAGSSPSLTLLSSKLIDQGGALVADPLMRHELLNKDRSVDAAERGLVRLRTATAGSVLMSARSAHGERPRAGLSASLAMFEWSARLLRPAEADGYLVPSSVVTVGSDVRRGEVWGRLRLLPGTAWGPSERLWEGFLLARESRRYLTGRLRGGRGSAERASGHRAGRAG